LTLHDIIWFLGIGLTLDFGWSCSEPYYFGFQQRQPNGSYKLRLNLSQPIDCYWWRHHHSNIIKIIYGGRRRFFQAHKCIFHLMEATRWSSIWPNFTSVVCLLIICSFFLWFHPWCVDYQGSHQHNWNAQQFISTGLKN